MISLNKVVIAGNLTRDPQSRQIRDGRTRVGLSVAVNHAFKNTDGQSSSETSFINVSTWNTTADRCLKHLKKGMPVLVEGRLRVSKFDARDGKPQYYTEVVAESVTFLSRPDDVALLAGDAAPEGTHAAGEPLSEEQPTSPF
ncbi:single-stranded DNA-binding protein [Candidatus Ozemobacteraceae bacterium]|nr:single-stranded DNA-binding protein [Candidatus Ozemobacteraceae bacterium]